LRACGLSVVCWPLTRIDEVPGLDWPTLLARLERCQWVLLPSPGAIEVTMAGLARHGLAWPAHTALGLIGPGSRDALALWAPRLPGLATVPVVEPLAPPHDAQALLAHPAFAQLAGVEVAVLRRADGSLGWLHTLRDRGAVLHPITVYAACPTLPPPEAAAWLAARADASAPVSFSIASADAGARLAAFVSELPCAAWVFEQPVLTQHPRIAQALEGCGWRRVIRHEPGSACLVAAIESAWRTRP
jgi:uroporphyrinogen-III synthase